MRKPPDDRRRRILARLHGWVSGCGALPLIGAVAMGSLGWMAPRLEAASAAPPLLGQEVLSSDGEIIDRVLARRAPDLGLVLRRQLGVAIAEESQRTGYDPLLILAIIDVESDFEEGAVSHKGAQGLMQVKPSTLHYLAEENGLRLTREEVASDPTVSVRLAIRYLRNLQDRFGGDLDLALMAYNAGPARIRKAIKEQKLQPFRRYPALVRRDFRRFREGQGLGGDWALAQRQGDAEADAAAASQGTLQ